MTGFPTGSASHSPRSPRPSRDDPPVPLGTRRRSALTADRTARPGGLLDDPPSARAAVAVMCQRRRPPRRRPRGGELLRLRHPARRDEALHLGPASPDLDQVHGGRDRAGADADDPGRWIAPPRPGGFIRRGRLRGADVPCWATRGAPMTSPSTSPSGGPSEEAPDRAGLVLLALILVAGVANLNLGGERRPPGHRPGVRLGADHARPDRGGLLARPRRVGALPGRGRRPLSPPACSGASRPAWRTRRPWR
jgi:hypothetical protein